MQVGSPYGPTVTDYHYPAYSPSLITNLQNAPYPYAQVYANNGAVPHLDKRHQPVLNNPNQEDVTFISDEAVDDEAVKFEDDIRWKKKHRSFTASKKPKYVYFSISDADVKRLKRYGVRVGTSLYRSLSDLVESENKLENVYKTEIKEINNILWNEKDHHVNLLPIKYDFCIPVEMEKKASKNKKDKKKKFLEQTKQFDMLSSNTQHEYHNNDYYGEHIDDQINSSRLIKTLANKGMNGKTVTDPHLVSRLKKKENMFYDLPSKSSPRHWGNDDEIDLTEEQKKRVLAWKDSDIPGTKKDGILPKFRKKSKDLSQVQTRRLEDIGDTQPDGGYSPEAGLSG